MNGVICYSVEDTENINKALKNKYIPFAVHEHEANFVWNEALQQYTCPHKTLYVYLYKDVSIGKPF